VARSIKLLLTENVDNLGIVGDVVNVRIGYARNYLLPRDLATEPSEEILSQLAEKRAKAEKELAALRAQREALISKLEGLELTMTRACNDQGHLYGSVTQHDIAESLTDLGFAVKAREVRLAQTIKRVDTYEVLVKFDTDLEATIKLWVVADRELDTEREEMEFDNEGNLIEKPAKKGEKTEAAPAAE
jgi:large subunit ribosomal protein L9